MATKYQTLEGFTPGPWSVEKFGTAFEIFSGDEGEKCHVARLFTATMDNAKMQPRNALLIASAPALYEENKLLQEQNRVLLEGCKDLMGVIIRICNGNSINPANLPEVDRVDIKKAQEAINSLTK